MRDSKHFLYGLLFVIFCLSYSCQPQIEEVAAPQKQTISVNGKEVPVNPLRDAYFGELHLHTSFSLDAFGIGNQGNSPEEAYRFAKGEEVELLGGGKTRITVPLDFAAVTDHSEWLGEVYMMTHEDHPKYDHPFAKMSRALDPKFFETILEAEMSGLRPADFSGMEGKYAYHALKNVWQRINEISENHYEPGKFTTLHGFEWTAAPDGNNLHRNLIFRSDEIPEQPVSWFEARTVEELWEWMENTGGGEENVMAIPHNANMSGGLMFQPTYSDGRPLDGAYAERRSRNEPLFEMMQAKGSSETHPNFAPNDEFANFELMPITNFVGPVENSPYMWVREALKQGLKHESELNTNPFKYGFVGGTDNHNGLTGDTDEFDFNGSHGLGDATPEGRLTTSQEVFKFNSLNPGGLTGVWADANAREHIWDALKRKETYGTSGVRIKVRFFGGFDYTPDMAKHREMVQMGYEKGVPMGGDLLKKNQNGAPTFLVWAIKDPQSGNLDRIQIIKGWQDANGELQEKIYNVTWSGDRRLDEEGNLPLIGNTVDPTTASYSNTIGSAQLSGFWQDPDFNSDERAFYYVRVIEIPTPRWSTYDAVKAGIEIPEGVPSSVQERAWSSPIWYNPK